MEREKCEFCNIDVKDKPSLKNHLNRNKKCLKIRGLSLDTKFICEGCENVFTSNISLLGHNDICKKYIILKVRNEYDKKIENLNENVKEKEKIISKLESKIEKLENTILSLAIEPKTKTTNHVVINNTLNLSKEHVTKILDEHLTKDVIAGGQKKLAHMVCEKMLKDSDGNLTYKCVDSSRHNFEFVNSKGLIEKDIKALKLKNALISGNIITKAGETGKQIWTKTDGTTNSDQYLASSDKVMEIICIDTDDSKFRSELSALTI